MNRDEAFDLLSQKIAVETLLDLIAELADRSGFCTPVVDDDGMGYCWGHGLPVTAVQPCAHARARTILAKRDGSAE